MAGINNMRCFVSKPAVDTFFKWKDWNINPRLIFNNSDCHKDPQFVMVIISVNLKIFAPEWCAMTISVAHFHKCQTITPVISRWTWFLNAVHRYTMETGVWTQGDLKLAFELEPQTSHHPSSFQFHAQLESIEILLKQRQTRGLAKWQGFGDRRISLVSIAVS